VRSVVKHGIVTSIKRLAAPSGGVYRNDGGDALTAVAPINDPLPTKRILLKMRGVGRGTDREANENENGTGRMRSVPPHFSGIRLDQPIPSQVQPLPTPSYTSNPYGSL
jgi:hypothetical protein